jgi:hypothetical protein
MPKRKEPELDPKEQFKRFQKTAKELGMDEKGQSQADAAFKTLAANQKKRPSRQR